MAATNFKGLTGGDKPPMLPNEPLSSGSDTVTIACKHPGGIVLRNFRMENRQEALAGGGYKEVQAAVEDGEPITIKGTAIHFGQQATHVDFATGFALTHGVDRESWERWLKDNKDSALVKNGLIFATNGIDRGQLLENSKLKSGLEPLDTTKPMRGIRKFDANKMDND